MAGTPFPCRRSHPPRGIPSAGAPVGAARAARVPFLSRPPNWYVERTCRISVVVHVNPLCAAVRSRWRYKPESPRPKCPCENRHTIHVSPPRWRDLIRSHPMPCLLPLTRIASARADPQYFPRSNQPRHCGTYPVLADPHRLRYIPRGKTLRLCQALEGAIYLVAFDMRVAHAVPP